MEDAYAVYMHWFMPQRMCIFERLYRFGAAVADAVLPPRNASKEREGHPLVATSKHSLISWVQKLGQGTGKGGGGRNLVARNRLGGPRPFLYIEKQIGTLVGAAYVIRSLSLI